MIEAGANPNIFDTDGQSALHLAAYGYHYNLSKILIQAGANHPMVEENGGTASYVTSVFQGQLRVLNTLKIGRAHV